MIIARQSTARTVMIGPILDADGAAVTDGVVGDLKISKNGGAPAALNGSATLTHRHTGHYSLALTASDLDTVGQAEVVIDDTVNSCAMKEITVVEEAVYDALFAASAPGYLQPTTAGRTLDVSAGGEAGVDWANVGSPTTTVNLSGTTVKTATDVETDTADIQSRLPAALTAGGNIKADALAVSGSTTAADNMEVVFATDFASNYDSGSDKWNVQADVQTIEGDSPGDFFTSVIIPVNVTHISGSATAADNAEIVFATDFATNYNTTLDIWNVGTVSANVSAIEGDPPADWFSNTLIPVNFVKIDGNSLVGLNALNDTWTATHASKINRLPDIAAGAAGGVLIAGSNAATTFATLTVTTNAIAWNSAWDAEVQSEVQDAIELNNLDHLLKTTAVAGDVTLGSVVARLASAGGDFSTYFGNESLYSLEAIGTNAVIIQSAVSSGTHGLGALKTLIDTVDDFLDTEIAAIKAKTDQLTFTVANKVDATADVALTEENIDDIAEGVAQEVGSASLTITPIQASATNPRYSTRDLAPIAQFSEPTEVFNITDGTGAAIDLSAKDLRLVVYTRAGEETNYQTGDDPTFDPYAAELAASYQYDTSSDGGITVGGADNNQVTVQWAEDDTESAGRKRYFLWNVTDNIVLAKGKRPVEPAVFEV